MSEDENTQDTETDESQEPQQSEREALEIRAKQLGLSFHPNISDDKLKERVNAKLSEGDTNTGAKDESDEKQEETAEAQKAGEAQASKQSERLRLKKEATKLHRVRITCMDPNKREWDGEVFCAGNSVVGSVKRMVPFDVEWHVEDILLKQIRQKKCQIFQTVTNDRGQKTRRGKLINAFSVEILPPLTEKELQQLKQRQLMANGQ